MPRLLARDGKTLFLQGQRCQGCEACIIACPTGVLEMSGEMNKRAAFIPRVKDGKERSCVLCQRCELACPAWAIYILEGEA